MSGRWEWGGSSGSVVLALCAVAVLVLVVRLLGFEEVLQDGSVVFPPADPQYHLRRAFYSFVNFPDVLLFDVYINHPGGAAISWPPLYDLAIAGVALILARDVHGFELVAAWVPPVLAASTAVPLWLAGRAMGTERVGLAAGVVFAFLPVSFYYSALGVTDHHVAVGVIGAWLLYLCLALVDPAAGHRRMAWLGTGLAVAQVAMLLTWHGSLLYLGLVQPILWVAAIHSGSRRLPAAQAAAAAAAAVVTVLVLAVSPEPLGGRYSSIALSRLHVGAMTAAAVVSLALVAASRSARSGVGMRAVWAAAGVALSVGVLLLVPGAYAGLLPAFGFVTLSDGAGLATNEQRALFDIFGRASSEDPTLAWG